MNITTTVKYKMIHLVIEDGGTRIEYDIWQSELIHFKKMLESAIEDIDYMLEKRKREATSKKRN